MKVNNSNKPGTAVVTGASSGIGKVYAERLAARGYDLILIARREDRLQVIANDLEKRFAIKPHVFVADLSQPAGLAAAIARINTDSSLSFLVNNAGFSALRPLSDTPLELINSMIALNITALTALSSTALVRFRERNAGVIVNVGSAVGFAPYPDVPVYGPTKAYVLQFTQILQHAVEDSGVRVQLVLPGVVISEGWDVAGGAALEPLPESMVMSTENCVDAALSGLDQGEFMTLPSLHDESLLLDYQAAAHKLLQGVFNREPAARYNIHP